MNQNNQIRDFFNSPINIGDYVAECYQHGIRVAKVLKINEKSLTLSCQKKVYTWKTSSKTHTYIASKSSFNIDEAIKHMKEHNDERRYPLYKVYNGVQANLINLTNLNLLSDEIIENWV